MKRNKLCEYLEVSLADEVQEEVLKAVVYVVCTKNTMKVTMVIKNGQGERVDLVGWSEEFRIM